MVTTYTLKNILENKDFILEYYKNDFKNCLKNIDDFIDYIFLNVILKFEECLEILKEEFKNELIKFLNHDIKIWYIELCLKDPNILKDNKVILEKLMENETVLFF